MTTQTPGIAPELTYEPSECNRALLERGLPLEPPETGVRYTTNELSAMREDTSAGIDLDQWRQTRRAVALASVARRRDERGTVAAD